MKDFADVHRHPAPRFAVGDWVLLNAKHIKTERPVKSLDHKNMGPYQITRVIDNMAYELDLPDSLKNIFPLFIRGCSNHMRMTLYLDSPELTTTLPPKSI
ncbi:Chromatin organization modifier domain protein [Pyrenophora tritici-repentis]|nr:Chromatin organization modifier domain protein [Pyrenophora tritici-repentis]